jgi:hypothetical protein
MGKRDHAPTWRLNDQYRNAIRCAVGQPMKTPTRVDQCQPVPARAHKIVIAGR